jgi:membrane associated rhomboid family serine protease
MSNGRYERKTFLDYPTLSAPIPSGPPLTLRAGDTRNPAANADNEPTEIASEPPPATNPPILWEVRDEDEASQALLPRRRERSTSDKFDRRKLVYRRVIWIYIATFVDVIMLGVALILNKGIESFDTNPFIGPSQSVLVQLGAKVVPKILAGEVWRLLTPAFLSAGVVQLVMTLLWHVRFGRELEKRLGWWRIALVYLTGTVCGMLLSSLMLPGEVTVGSSAALFAMFGCAIAELMMMQHLASASPRCDMALLTLSVVLALVLGLLPFNDNFANLGGLFFGGAMAAFCISTTPAAAILAARRTCVAGVLGLSFVVCG